MFTRRLGCQMTWARPWNTGMQPDRGLEGECCGVGMFGQNVLRVYTRLDAIYNEYDIKRPIKIVGI
jgi:hypothetical protein